MNDAEIEEGTQLNDTEKEEGIRMNERAESNERKVSELKDPGRCVQKCLQNVKTYAASRSGPKEFAIKWNIRRYMMQFFL